MPLLNQVCSLERDAFELKTSWSAFFLDALNLLLFATSCPCFILLCDSPCLHYDSRHHDDLDGTLRHFH